MPIKKRVIPFVGIIAIALALPGCAPSGDNGDDGASYPDGPINYVVPYNPGGSTDPVGREFSRLLAEALGTTAVVENLPGGDETIGLTAVMRAPSDGQSMGLSSATGIIVQPLINESLPFQGPEDYLRSRGVTLEVVDDERCVRLMREFIAARPELWNEDIGV